MIQTVLYPDTRFGRLSSDRTTVLGFAEELATFDKNSGLILFIVQGIGDPVFLVPTPSIAIRDRGFLVPTP